MHTHKRLAIIALFLSMIAPLGLTAQLLNGVTQEQIDAALDDARDGYRISTNLSLGERELSQIVADADKKLKTMVPRAHVLRVKILGIFKTLKQIGVKSGVLADTQSHATTVYETERERLEEFVRISYLRSLSAGSGPNTARLVLRRLLRESLGESVEADVREEVMVRARSQLLASVLQARDAASLAQAKLTVEAGDLAETLRATQKERETLLSDTRALQKKRDAAAKNLAITRARLEAVRVETDMVMKEVLRMQSEMARIDERLRVRAERELVQKGLRADSPDRFHRDLPADDGKFFHWPVNGRLTAGFGDGPYRNFFGVPHRGQDIAVPQNTEVHSAADGIVFLAHDGGLKGFSYILIGHRDGYATLYGHLSSFTVGTGEVVKKDQVIGYSGGAPGSHGAGPMTTGSHLHFEVIKAGVHIDPQSVLPPR